MKINYEHFQEMLDIHHNILYIVGSNSQEGNILKRKPGEILQWTLETIAGVKLPFGADPVYVVNKANELLTAYSAYIERRKAHNYVVESTLEDYSRGLLENIEDCAYYFGAKQDNDPWIIPADIFVDYGIPKNRAEIAKFLNWKAKAFFETDCVKVPVSEYISDVVIAWEQNDRTCEMAWCISPEEPTFWMC